MQRNYKSLIKKIKNDNPSMNIDELKPKIYDIVKGMLYEKYKGEPGYIYCLHNEVYNYYGPNYYKLGECGDLKSRMNGYTTPFLTASRYVCVSTKLSSKNLAEHILFHLLKKYRCASNREFFNCDIDLIHETFKNIEMIFKNLTNEELVDRYVFEQKKMQINICINKLYEINKSEKKIDKSEKAITSYFNYLSKDIDCNTLDRLTIIKINDYKKIADVLRIQNRIQFDYDHDKTRFLEKITDQVLLNSIEDIKHRFNIRGKKYKNFADVGGYERLYKMAISICKQLFGNNIISIKEGKIRYGTKVESIVKYSLNRDYFENIGYDIDF